MQQPILARHARYRWDRIRGQHQLVFPEGILVLNESAAAIVQLLDGRSLDAVRTELEKRFAAPADDLFEFLDRLAKKGLLRDAADPQADGAPGRADLPLSP